MAGGINFSGLASGIDTAALIQATSDATRAARVAPSEKRLTELEETNAAAEELTTKLDLLKASLKNFTTINGGGVSKTATSSKESVLAASVTNSAINGAYSVLVTSLAKNHTYSFDQTFASSSTALDAALTGSEPALDRTVTFTVGTGGQQETVSVEVTDGSFTISDFVTAFNNASTKAQASLVNTGSSASPAYKIVVSSNYEGTEKGTITRTALGASLGVLTAAGEDAATDASVTVTGIGTVTRATNSISDIIPGVTLSLSSTGTATVRISEDPDTTVSKVQDFIDTYNDVVKYINEGNVVTRDETKKEVTNTFGPLAATRVDDNALTALRSAISASKSAGGTAIRIFADLGITTQRDGTLLFDSAKLKSAIASEPTSVSDVLSSFADTAAKTGGTIDIYTRFNGLIDLTINTNKDAIADLNDRIQETERQIERQEESMRARYARLESLMSKLQQQQSSLTSALRGLG
jgi:flagellar hook-associated protein 2